MFHNPLGAEFRRVEDREHDGKPAKVVVATRLYDTDREDLWDALTNRTRIPRWFLPVEGDLRLGGRYQLQGNAGGTITRCDPPEALDLTWEFGGSTSWVTVRLATEGERTKLTLEHIALASDTDQHWKQFGPGAVGVGWDLALGALERYMKGNSADRVDPQAAAAWMRSPEGKSFMRACAEAWSQAHITAGEDPEIARGMAERTAAFYTGG
jgi:uncharacterized protein YndB with AHSA1/START domain